MGDLQLDTPAQYVKGVGPARAEQLARLGIRTVEDLLLYFPRRFDLRRQTQPIDTLRGDEPSATVAGEVTEVSEQRYGKRPWFGCMISDETGWLLVKWFHGGYLRGKIREGMHIAVSGKVGTYREHLQMVNPNWQPVWDPDSANLDADELLPVYPAGADLTSGRIAQVIRRVLPDAERLIPEILPGDILQRRDLPGRPRAVAAMHRPEDTEQWDAARRRMAYEECFLMQLGIAMNRIRRVSRPAHALTRTDEIDRRIRARFGFELTGAQNRAVEDIAADVARERPMNRLLQGDVGAGKTVVALYAALLAVANRAQAAIMAPTEILAAQHYRNIQAYLQGSRVRTALLVGGQNPKQRTRLLDGLATGSIDIVVGTHALITEQVRFARLALVVVDEQHKFGVRQRTGIRSKGYAPHYLVMTATPIPRTLAITVFGDLDVSVIDELPPGRGETTTRCVSSDRMDEVLGFVRERLADGQQAYVICPLVQPSPQLQLKAVEEIGAELSDGALKDFTVAVVHGQMPPDRKEQVIAEFRAGRIDALVASVVVEVGMDIPAANVMVVLHAERFGLAQLHQLRGRIGRSEQDATCILVAEPGNPIAQRRLEVLTETHDGFTIAEEDLRIRGPGELFGTRQHGLPELKVADLIEDLDLLRDARRDAFALVRDDPSLSGPHHQTLREEMEKLYADRLDLIAGA
ncbi:MAG: ATP-dependent DNA helicase RecG [Phycisphaerae bacterium]|nr:ATP-dependent DNA helicase RecG [Phycisphaerae bacterium]